MFVIKAGDAELVVDLLKSLDINSVNNRGETTLYIASEVYRILLQRYLRK